MSRTFLIARKELVSFFDSLIAYILLILFLGVTGLFTWFLGSPVFLRGQADLTAFTGTAYWVLFLFIPAITMRSLAEEKRTGTLDLLLTKAVNDHHVVLGKYVGAMVLIGIALLCTLPYYISISMLGNVDHGALWCGYLALLMMSSAYVAIGLFASSITDNQIVAFLLALACSVVFHVVFEAVSVNFTGTIGATLEYLGTGRHFDSMSRGVVDSRDLLYFLGITVIGLALAELNLAKRTFKGA